MMRLPSGRSEAGFTLVEVLAALVLASLILVSLNMAMSAVDKGAARTRRSLGEQSEIGSAVSIFGRDVARIAKIRRPAPPDQFDGYVFDGARNVMVYPLREEAALADAGLYLVRLSIARKNGQSVLLRERAPFPLRGDNALPKWRDPVVLLSGPFDIAFAYRAQRSGQRQWSDRWVAVEAMPEQIRLTVTDTATGRLRVPGFVQSLAIDSEVDCAGSRDARCGGGEAEATQ
ncbi:MAG: prepilin-type N-terminal cleavage/methylation domain-containing protein [Aestuariivirga sp.]|uniref:prepilin-type N-terminal cleavage/methylation domain-containing protein n=1 Tax=Aestuariivirga sp. TaxID=2650926 RepID=UPI0025B91658|nr:prepilin-type N-terminal cleavage/methylation domain-containing protein [Aestuariivirga sp.]MCA3561118.1 prepilin-type N-terminal cleavage/methylation domain-containing protein [Aestuariivirga sp.]